eukprot:5836811-Alexandrium_andersonii.AAC.1
MGDARADDENERDVSTPSSPHALKGTPWGASMALDASARLGGGSADDEDAQVGTASPSPSLWPGVHAPSRGSRGASMQGAANTLPPLASQATGVHAHIASLWLQSQSRKDTL